MIHNYKYWKLLESLGNGEETFEEDLEMHGKLSNLDIYSIPSVWGDELESASGKLTYLANLEVSRSGIEDIYFKILNITLLLEIRVYKDKDDKDDEGELITKEIEITKEMIVDDNETLEKYSFPYYLNRLEIDFSKSEKDFEVDFSKVKYTLEMGTVKS